MKRIMLTGATGFLGANFCRLYSGQFEIHAVGHRYLLPFPGIHFYKADLSNAEQVHSLWDAVKPDAVIHLAALSDPNKCELNPQLSFQYNVLSACHLAELAAKHHTPLITASTDLVFDGLKAPYKEDDKTNPISVYGRHKAQMERDTRERDPDTVICRLPLMYGLSYSSGVSFIQPMLKKLKSHEQLSLFTDEFRTAASARDVCRGLINCLETRGGIYHLSGDERFSRFEFGKLLCEAWALDISLLKPSLQKDVIMPAARPKDVSLENNKAKALNWQPRNVREELEHLYFEEGNMEKAGLAEFIN